MKALEILSRSSANLEGSIVLSREEVDHIRAKIENMLEEISGIGVALHAQGNLIDYWRKKCEEQEAKLHQDETYIKFQNKHIKELEAHIARQNANHDRLMQAMMEQEAELQAMGARNPGIPYPSDEPVCGDYPIPAGGNK